MAFTVVGVVGDVRSTALTQESPALYYPMLLAFVAAHGRRRRIRQHAGSVASLNPSEDARTDAELALANVRTMEEWLSNSAAPPRLNTVPAQRVSIRGVADRLDWHLRRAGVFGGSAHR